MNSSCTLDDIQAVINRPEFFTVDDEGNARAQVDTGELNCIESYLCTNCDTFFTPDSYGKAYREWPKVLEHIGHEPVAA